MTVMLSGWLHRLPGATIQRSLKFRARPRRSAALARAGATTSHAGPDGRSYGVTAARLLVMGGDGEGNRRLATAIQQGYERALQHARPAASAACAAFRVFVDFSEAMGPLSAQELQEAASPTAQAYLAALRAAAQQSACLSPEAEFLLLKKVHTHSESSSHIGLRI